VVNMIQFSQGLDGLEAQGWVVRVAQLAEHRSGHGRFLSHHIRMVHLIIVEILGWADQAGAGLAGG